MLGENTIDRTAEFRTAGLIALLWMAGLGAAAQYGKFAVTFQLLTETYPEGGAYIGFALSLVGFVGIALGVVAGILGARIGMTRCLVWGLALGAALSFLQSLGLPLHWLLATRVLEGLSHLAIVVAAPTLIARIAPMAWRGFAMTLWGTFFGVAFTALVWLGLPLVAVAGLNALYFAHGIWMAIFAIVFVRISLPLASEQRPEAVNLRQILALHVSIYRSPFKNAAAVGWLFYTLCFVSLLTLLPPEITPEWRAFTVGMMPLMGIVGSMTLGVFLLRYISAVRVAVLGFLVSAGLVLGLWFVPGQPALCLALGFSLGLVQGAGFTMVPQLNEAEEDRAEANGAMAQTGNLGNTVGTPLMLAVLGSTGYGGMMALCFAVLLTGALAHMALSQMRRA